MTGSPDLMEGLRALDEAAPAYDEALNYAEAALPERFATDAMRRILAAGGERYRFRYAHLPVNAVKNRCQISAFRAEAEAVTAAIETLREANDLETYEPWITERWLILGDAYLFVWPDEDAGIIDISYQSPFQVRAMYGDDQGRELIFVIRRWEETVPAGVIKRAEVWYADRMESWVTLPGGAGTDEKDWEPWIGEDGDPEPWPFMHEWGEIPFKHLRTALPYGRPEHINAYGPQDAITKAVATQVEADLEAHGWPERYRIADDQRALEMGQDSIRWGDVADPDNDRSTRSDGTARNVETARTRGAGREHVYTGTKAVGVFEPPDPSQLIEPIRLWIEMMSTVTETPLYEFDPKSGMQLSGVSREKADRPLAAKVEARRRALDTVWCQQLWPLALRMAGVSAESPIGIVWTPPPVQSDPEWWMTAAQRAALGVPTRVILQEANYAPEDIEQWLDANAEDASLDQRIARAKALGEAMQAIGTGVTLGVISAEGAEGLLMRIMKEAGEVADPFPSEADRRAKEEAARAIAAGPDEEDER